MLKGGQSPNTQCPVLQHDRKCAFTLAELLITLAILGVIAVITVPNIIKNNQTRIYKTKIKKAFSSYDKLMNQIMIENDLRTNSQIDMFSKNNNCENTREYFKSVKNGSNNCRFKTSDGLWWDISDIRTTIVGIKKQENLTSSKAKDLKTNDAFYFISGFDDNNIVYKINSLEYFGSNSDVVSTKKLLDYIFDNVSQLTWKNFQKSCNLPINKGQNAFGTSNYNCTHTYYSAYPSLYYQWTYIYNDKGNLLRQWYCHTQSTTSTIPKDCSITVNTYLLNGLRIVNNYNAENPNNGDTAQEWKESNNTDNSLMAPGNKKYAEKCNESGTICATCNTIDKWRCTQITEGENKGKYYTELYYDPSTVTSTGRS